MDGIVNRIPMDRAMQGLLATIRGVSVNEGLESRTIPDRGSARLQLDDRMR